MNWTPTLFAIMIHCESLLKKLKQVWDDTKLAQTVLWFLLEIEFCDRKLHCVALLLSKKFISVHYWFSTFSQLYAFLSLYVSVLTYMCPQEQQLGRYEPQFDKKHENSQRVCSEQQHLYLITHTHAELIECWESYCTTPEGCTMKRD